MVRMAPRYLSVRARHFGPGIRYFPLDQLFDIGRARHPGPDKRYFTPGHLSVEFVNVGGWLTYGDLALDSCAQFLAVAEHRLNPV